MKKYLRAIQTLFPYLEDTRFLLTSRVMKFRKIPHEKDFLVLERFKPNPGQVFIDVGADRGMTILSILLFPHITNRIIGFEPNPLVFNKLENSRFIRNNRVKAYRLGLSNSNEELTLYIPFYRKWMFDGLASFDYESAKNWLTHRLWRFNPDKLSIKEVKCQVRKLDDFDFNPYFIKIDVQGYELNVLKGAEKTIKAHRPILLIECVTPDIVQFLEQYGYLSFFYSKGRLSKGIGNPNTFCMTMEKYTELISTIKIPYS
jgi:FkbM family methyltransferase